MDNQIPSNGSNVPEQPPVQQTPVQPVQQPVYQAPPQPAYQQPVYQVPPQPVYQQPVYQVPPQPVYQQPVYKAPPQPVYQQPVRQAPPQPVYQQPVYKAPPQPVYQQPVYQVPPQNKIKQHRQIPTVPLIMVIILATWWMRDFAEWCGRGYSFTINSVILNTVGLGLMVAGVCRHKNGRSILFASGLFVAVLANLLAWRFYLPEFENIVFYLHNNYFDSLISAAGSLLCNLLCIVIGVAYIVNKKPFATTVKFILSIAVLVVSVLCVLASIVFVLGQEYLYNNGILRSAISEYVAYGLVDVAAAVCFMTFTPAKEKNV
ncbi:MAG: hypothetical protein IJB11_01785 [Oscillospiraceae bacterium]|nr:hypothetical protein [Oscillospiraceae bacterium]